MRQITVLGLAPQFLNVPILSMSSFASIFVIDIRMRKIIFSVTGATSILIALALRYHSYGSVVCNRYTKIDNVLFLIINSPLTVAAKAVARHVFCRLSGDIRYVSAPYCILAVPKLHSTVTWYLFGVEYA